MSTTTLIGPMPGTPEWLIERRKRVTATAVARIMTGEAFPVYCELAGLTEPFSGNQHTRRGTRWESAILGDYEDQEGVTLQRPMPLCFDTETALAATPDAAYTDAPIGVEAKFSMSPAIAAQLGEEGSDWVPDRWLWQVQCQMAVMGWQRVDIACLLYGRLRVFRVDRHETLVRQCRAAAEEMHGRLQRLDPPEPDWTSPASQEAVKAMYGVDEGAAVDLCGTEPADRWREYQTLGEEIKALESLRKAAQAQVLAAMGEASIGRLGGGLELVRSRVERKPYTVAATSYVQLRQRKSK